MRKFSENRFLLQHLFAALVLLAGLLVQGSPAQSRQAPIQVYAAASLADVMAEIADTYQRETQVKVLPILAASSTLARQIEAGAPADIFLSADERWMDYLEEKHRIRQGSRHVLLRGRLALIAPKNSRHSLQIAPRFPLGRALGPKGRLAVGDPGHVPAGRYAEQALRTLAVWQDVAPRLARAEDVRMALGYVARGEAPLGIVYETDALREPRVKLLGLFPENSHAPIHYPVALVERSLMERSPVERSGPATQKAKALNFMQWLESAKAKAIFRKYGFHTQKKTQGKK